MAEPFICYLRGHLSHLKGNDEGAVRLLRESVKRFEAKCVTGKLAGNPGM